MWVCGAPWVRKYGANESSTFMMSSKTPAVSSLDWFTGLIPEWCIKCSFEAFKGGESLSEVVRRFATWETSHWRSRWYHIHPGIPLHSGVPGVVTKGHTLYSQTGFLWRVPPTWMSHPLILGQDDAQLRALFRKAIGFISSGERPALYSVTCFSATAPPGLECSSCRKPWKMRVVDKWF